LGDQPNRAAAQLKPPTSLAIRAGLDQVASTLPFNRRAVTDEVAAAAVFLGSEEASYVDGAVLAEMEDEPRSEPTLRYPSVAPFRRPPGA
jgi:NAD(P)-dependent dehydrogenase (short-subunit alcohol dehydrogenase family)